MKRITLGDFKRITRGLPDDAIVCLYSDSEGNEKSTALDVFTEIVGDVYKEEINGHKYEFVGADDVYGIDMEKDKGKTVVYLQPSL